MVDIPSRISEADIILTVGHYMAPGKVMKKWQLNSISHGLSHRNVLGKIISKGKKKLTFRLDGLRRIYAPEAWEADEPLIENLHLADSVVFQSNYSRVSIDFCASFTRPPNQRLAQLVGVNITVKRIPKTSK